MLELYLLVFVIGAGGLYLFVRHSNKPESASRRPHLKIRTATARLRWEHYTGASDAASKNFPS